MKSIRDQSILDWMAAGGAIRHRDWADLDAAIAFAEALGGDWAASPHRGGFRITWAERDGRAIRVPIIG
jgi:hypothetical protein